LQASFERTLIEAALEATGGHRGEAARRLGLGRNTLARKIRDLGID
jgi:nitrogen metabolism transcriptional regulator, ntrC, fis family